MEAQRRAIVAFAAAEGFTIIAEFTEIETGKGSDALDRRPQLKAALEAAKKAKCEVAVAKRMARSAPCQPFSLGKCGLVGILSAPCVLASFHLQVICC